MINIPWQSQHWEGVSFLRTPVQPKTWPTVRWNITKKKPYLPFRHSQDEKPRQNNSRSNKLYSLLLKQSIMSERFNVFSGWITTAKKCGINIYVVRWWLLILGSFSRRKWTFQPNQPCPQDVGNKSLQLVWTCWLSKDTNIPFIKVHCRVT